MQYVKGKWVFRTELGKRKRNVVTKANCLMTAYLAINLRFNCVGKGQCFEYFLILSPNPTPGRKRRCIS